MPSIKSRIFYLFLKYYTSRADKNATLQQRRAILEDNAHGLRMPPNVDVKQTAPVSFSIR